MSSVCVFYCVCVYHHGNATANQTGTTKIGTQVDLGPITFCVVLGAERSKVKVTGSSVPK